MRICKKSAILRMKLVLAIAGLLFSVMLAFLSYAQVQGVVPNNFESAGQYYQPSFQEYYSGVNGVIDYKTLWPILAEPEKCEARQDFIVQIRPGGCQPEVVRSDLLEEQNVPVFCKLDAVKLNPLIDVAAVKSVRFQGSYPEDVAGISFHPSQAALRMYNKVLDSPLINDIGYVVVVLKKQENEKSMPKFVAGNLTAVISYDMEHLFGSGKPVFYSPVLSQEDWEREYKKYGFFKGKGYIRTEWADKDAAGFLIYLDKDRVLSKISLKKGETSKLVYVPGFYCSGGFYVKLNDIGSGKKRALVQLDNSEVWIAEGGKILGNNCVVESIYGAGGGSGNIVLRCKGNSISLRVGLADKLIFEKNNEKKEISLGGVLNSEVAENRIYFVYSGIDKSKEKDKQLFAVLVKNSNSAKLEKDGSLSQTSLAYISQNFEKWKSEAGANWNDKDSSLLSSIKNQLGADGAEIVFASGTAGTFKYSLKEKSGLKDRNLEDYKKINSAFSEADFKLINAYFNESYSAAYGLVQMYGSEKKATGEFLGAEALYELASLADKLGKLETERKILIDLKDKYPSSYLARDAEKKIDELGSYDYENSATLVPIGMETHFVKLESVEIPGYEEASAEFLISGENKLKKFLTNEFIIGDNNQGVYAKLISLDDNEITVEYAQDDKDGKLQQVKTEKIKKGEQLVLLDVEKEKNNIKRATLQNIYLKRFAELEIISKIPDTITETNFSFHIGIEKRAIKLNPDKALEKISNLNESIEKWQGIADKLANVIKPWKGACFATSAGLIVKNFFSNLGGRSLARQATMRNPGGWFDKCNQIVAQGLEDVKSVDECLAKHNSDIEKSIDEVEKKMADVNKEVAKANDKNTKSTGIFGSQTDSKQATKDFASSSFKPFVRSQGENIKVDINGEKKQLSDLSNEEIDSMVDNGELSVSQMRDIMVYGSLSEKENEEMRNRVLENNLEPVFMYQDEARARAEFQTPLETAIPGARINSLKPQGKYEYVSTVSVPSDKISGVQAGKYTIVSVPQNLAGKSAEASKHGGKVLLVPVKQEGDGLKIDYFGEKTEDAAYVLSKSADGKLEAGEKVSKEEMNRIMTSLNIGKFAEITKADCENKYINAEVKYYETEPYKGMPAVVPVDVEKGWYAATKQILSGFATKSYTQAGAVSSLWICNVGKNGREEWEASSSDDKPCIQINYDTGQPLTQIPCLDEGAARRLALKAKKIIEQAASQHGKSNVVLDSGRFKARIASRTTALQCQDFMSPQDCSILFNVCDPVICPASRCDLGGRFPVDDVVQSGIIGSLVLCLPNFGNPAAGGVAVPVCLTGVQAGLEAYVSILKGMRDCLQENVNSGKYIGICDEIYSIYLCEFFWRQFAPFMDVLVPKMIEYAYTGGRMQGGGEYANVQNAWDTMQQSTRYMTDVYGANAFKAFQARSTGELGSEVCKAFVSTRYPSDFNKLLEPESPVQFNAWFDEIPFSDATVPATSQYKVYYHIFAGKDSGHYYSVYLKSPPETAYYSQQYTIVVDTGYAGIGQNIDITKDFTAPSGYKELCVRIDTKDECGFKSVSTSYALNYLKDKYAENQVESVESEKECVSGTPSVFALAKPNIQEGIQETANPEIYKRGIIRVCSSDNPGARTDSGRWEDIGYCDKGKGIRCWLDTNSVKNAIKDIGIENKTLQEAEKIANKELLGEKKIYDEEKTSSDIGSARDKIEKEKTLERVEVSNLGSGFDKATGTIRIDSMPEPPKNLLIELRDLREKGYFNSQRASAYALEFNVWKTLTEKIAQAKNIFGISEKISVSVEKKTLINEEDEKKIVSAFVLVDGKWEELNLNQAKKFAVFPISLKLGFSNKFKDEKPTINVKFDKNWRAFDEEDLKQSGITKESDGRWSVEFEIQPTDEADDYSGTWNINIVCGNCDKNNKNKKIQFEIK